MGREDSSACNEIITWLQDWYGAQCDDDWEHQYGVRIDTLDNPGWTVRIDLAGTVLEDASFPTVDEAHRSEDDWIYCGVSESRFQGAGGAHNLLEILWVFRSWAEDASKR